MKSAGSTVVNGVLLDFLVYLIFGQLEFYTSMRTVFVNESGDLT